MLSPAFVAYQLFAELLIKRLVSRVKLSLKLLKADVVLLLDLLISLMSLRYVFLDHFVVFSYLFKFLFLSEGLFIGQLLLNGVIL